MLVSLLMAQALAAAPAEGAKPAETAVAPEAAAQAKRPLLVITQPSRSCPHGVQYAGKEAVSKNPLISAPVWRLEDFPDAGWYATVLRMDKDGCSIPVLLAKDRREK